MTCEPWLLDACSIIGMKTAVKVGNQWEFFKLLEEQVEAGKLVIPQAVIREVGGPKVKHPDMPGAWARGMQPKITHQIEPDPAIVREVMQAVPDVIDHEADTEQADPYVLALALQLQREGHPPTVVTDDVINHGPIRISVAAACEELDLPQVRLAEFLDEVEGL